VKNKVEEEEEGRHRRRWWRRGNPEEGKGEK
jgi:hypothetical protein